MYSRFIIYVASILILLTFGAVAFADDNASGITVNGSAEIKAKPDLAYVTFGVTVESATAVDAAQENARKTSAVIDAIEKFGIPRADIETVGYSVSPVMDYKTSPPVKVGYSVSNQVQVKIKDLDKVGNLIDVAIAAGANNVQGVNFTIADDTAVKQQALVQAIKNAQAKARVIAEALGVNLGRVTAVSESSGFTPRPLVYGAAKMEDVTTPIIPGEVEVTANVTLIYAIQ